jgi:S1-C subfamily serine protease
MSTETGNSNPSPSPSSPPSPFFSFSQATAGAVAALSPFAVQVDTGRRLSASGAVFAADGLIVAASHNVERDEEVAIGLDGGRRLPARVVGRDAAADLVVLRVEASGLPVPSWADGTEAAALRAGELAVVVGRPGRQVRAALAMVSDVRESWRSPSGARLGRYVEIDAGRERGFSGSLVAAAGGRPLGIASSGLLRGRGLVLPADTLRRVAESLLSHGRVRRGYLGIGAYPVRLPAALEASLGQPVGLMVVGAEAEGPAEQAGILLGDVLLAIEGQPLSDLANLHAQLGEERIGKPVTLRILRAGEPREVAVTLGAR